MMPSFSDKVSVVIPIYNAAQYLGEMIDSVVAQTYPTWELVLVNSTPQNKEMAEVLGAYTDERIKVLELPENLGIVGNTNAGIHAATGDYVAFLDHDDVLDANLLAAYATQIAKEPATDLFYCDEDNFTEDLSTRYAPRFKPDMNLEFLHSHNYVVHCLMVSRYVLEQIELSPEYVNGAQDYDLTLKALEKARAVYHAPHILYHWRSHSGSTNGGNMDSKPYAIEAGRRALADHFERMGVAAKVSASHIPCIYNIEYMPLAEAAWQEIELNPSAPFKEQFQSTLEAQQFDYALVRSKTVQLNEGAAEQLVAIAEAPYVGVAAPKLFYADGLVEHAGIAYGTDHIARKINRNYTDDMGGGYHGFAECCSGYSATGSDCFALSRQNLEQLAKSSEATLADALAELEYALIGQSKQVIVTPLAQGTIKPLFNEDTASVRHEEKALYNPAVEYTSGYPRLRINRNLDAEARELAQRLTQETKYKRSIKGRVRHALKRILLRA